MTLLEALLATVILSVVAIGCLEGTRNAAQLQRKAELVSAATVRAESELARAVLGLPAGDGVDVVRQRYAANPQLELVRVRVPQPDGGQVELARLVEQVTVGPR
jgi:type II secretory pathway pseudopilin PulG